MDNKQRLILMGFTPIQSTLIIEQINKRGLDLDSVICDIQNVNNREESLDIDPIIIKKTFAIYNNPSPIKRGVIPPKFYKK